jgi:hypothetical protein
MTNAWTGEARVLLERAIGRTFEFPPRIDVFPHECRAVFHEYPTAGQRGVFRTGAVELLDGAGDRVAANADARASFRGLRKWRRWSPADALYFFGYALTHYCGLPFTLGEGRPLALRRVRGGGRRLTGVEVELPATLHTHCRRQTFYFDDEGLLRRHDYVADIVGWMARGAHLWRDFVTARGIPIPRERHVVVRFGRATTPIVALHAELDVIAD